MFDLTKDGTDLGRGAATVQARKANRSILKQVGAGAGIFDWITPPVLVPLSAAAAIVAYGFYLRLL